MPSLPSIRSSWIDSVIATPSLVRKTIGLMRLYSLTPSLADAVRKIEFKLLQIIAALLPHCYLLASFRKLLSRRSATPRRSHLLLLQSAL
jgi:hypothetical protein